MKLEGKELRGGDVFSRMKSDRVWRTLTNCFELRSEDRVCSNVIAFRLVNLLPMAMYAE